MTRPSRVHLGQSHIVHTLDRRDGVLAFLAQRLQRVLALAAEETVVPIQVPAEDLAVLLLLALVPRVDPQFALDRIEDQHVELLRPVVHADRLAFVVDSALGLERIAVPDEKPDAIVADVGEDLGVPATFLLFEKVVQVLLHRVAVLRHGRHGGPEGLKGPWVSKELLGVLAFQKLAVFQPHLDGHVARRRTGLAFDLDTGFLRGCEQTLHPFRRCHLMDKVEGLSQARRQLVRLHQQRGQRVIVDCCRGVRLRQSEPQRLQRFRVVREK